MSMHPYQNIAIRAAMEAGKLIARATNNLDRVSVFEKSHHDFATEIDRQCENEITDIILGAYPEHDILGEEFGLKERTSKRPNIKNVKWIIDPIDGTMNFIRGIPHFCVSIAVTCDDEIAFGVIYDPIRDELFTAAKGQGARLNNKKLNVSPCRDFDLAILGSSMHDMSIVNNIEHQFFGMRRTGSAALDLAYVAAGRIDAYVQKELKIWDFAAGILLVREAGGIVTGFTESSDPMNTMEIVAAPRLLHGKIISKL